jgi:hypothetical protein
MNKRRREIRDSNLSVEEDRLTYQIIAYVRFTCEFRISLSTMNSW